MSLATEIQNDPKGLGYAAKVANGSDQGLADILNTPGPDSTYDIFRDSVPVRDIIASIPAADFVTLTQLQLSQLQLLLLTGNLDATATNTQQILAGIFSGATKTAIIAICKKRGSRAEVLFGINTVVSALDVARALGRG